MRINSFSISTGLLACAALAGCAADSTSPNGTGARAVSISFAATAANSASASLSPSGVLLSSASADAITITKVELVVARLELQRVGATCTSDASAGDDDHGDDNSCAELELAPSVVDLPVDGSVASKLQVAVPAGTYSALEAKIRPIRTNNGNDGRGTSAFLTAHPDLAGVSIRVTGTFNGKPFVYTGSPKAEFETSFNPPVTVDSTGVNLTVQVDLSTWFRTSSGTLIDPATANAGSANAALVSDNIRRSFKAFQDDDHDGRDDHGEHGSNHP